MKVYVVEGYEYGRLIQFGMTDKKDLAETIAKEYEDNTEEKSFVVEYELNNNWIEFNDEHHIEEEEEEDDPIGRECPYGDCDCCENLYGWCTVQYEDDLDCDYGIDKNDDCD